MDYKLFENEIKSFKMEEVTLDSVLKFKNLSNKISIAEKKILWENFEYNIGLLKLNDYGIEVDKELMDINEYPKNIILTIRQKVSLIIKTETNPEIKEKLCVLKKNLSNLYIEYEDMQDDIQTDTNYLLEMIDEKFSWLDDDEEFIQIAELLEKISKEVCAKIQIHIEEKRKFHTEYIETTYKLNAGQNMSDYSKLYISNYIKTYILKNFCGMFDQICLDVLEANGIKEEKDIKTIISLYYDHTKQMLKLFLTLNDIDMRSEIFDKNINQEV